MTRLRAIEEFPYDNKTRHPGEIFEASESDAHVLTTIGKAEMDPHEQVRHEPKTYSDKIMTPEKSDESIPNKRGRYMRRDMRAKE